MKNFFTYQKSVEFYREIKDIKLPYYIKDQFLRAASSVSLNLAEGSAKFTRKDQVKFYNIALASLRECQAVIAIHNLSERNNLQNKANFIALCIWRLIKSRYVGSNYKFLK